MAEQNVTDESIILIASDSSSEAALVQKLLGDDFGKVITSAKPGKATEDFDRYQPSVLILAFNTIEKCQHYYLSLYRHSVTLHLQPHRTILLCNKDEINQAYKLCCEGLFDDYVFFWPIVHDPFRLPMSVFVAQRELLTLTDDGPSVADFAAQARQLTALEPMLNKQVMQGSNRIKASSNAVAQAEQNIIQALDGLSSQLSQGESVAGNTADLAREITNLKEGNIRQSFETVAESVRPLQQWADGFRQACEPHLASVRSLDSMAQSVRPTVMVVDDDEFQRNLVSKILEDENYHIVFAGSGIELLNALRKIRPDLILMDIMMPGMDGMETTRKVKSIPQRADIPIIMVTGRREKDAVTKSLNAGAMDFVVKPFERETLIAKVASGLSANKTVPE